MIKVEISPNKIIMSGHAMYDDYGKDIVCASVSSILITTVNAIISFDKDAIVYKRKKDKFQIDLKKHDTITDKLIKNMCDLLLQLEKDYPNNISIK